MDNFLEQYKSGILQHLLGVCTDAGLLKGTLLATPDIDQAWVRYAPAFYGDAVSNFNSYPEFCLGCAGYLGMAVAKLWDQDWARYSEASYSIFQGERGFDDMDDHITSSILKDGKWSVDAMQMCAANAYHYLMRQCPEPGTADAYRMFLSTVEAMFKIGAAIQLHHLGYKFEAL